MNTSKQLPHQTAEGNRSRVEFWGIIVIGALAALANIFLLRSALRLPATTISYFARALHGSIILAGSVMILLTIRGHQKLGAQVAFYTAVMLFVAGSFIYAESVITASFSLITIAAIIITQLLPKESWRRSIVITAVAVMITWVAAWINPPWRLPPTTVGVAGMAVSIFFALILTVIVVSLTRDMIASSIRIQITVWTGTLVAILAIALVTYSIITNREAAIRSAESEALAIAEAHAAEVKTELDPALDAARTMAYSLGVAKDPVHPIVLTREQANGILRKVAEENPAFLGTWTIWEPNAFDGQDAQYANTHLHDSTGRFIPYWVRVNNIVHGEAVRDYEESGAGDFYVVPRQTKKETLLSPYYYEIDGKKVLLTTISIPIVEKDRFYGVAGVDLKIDFVQSIVDKIDLYNGQATAALVTDTGTLVAVRNQPDQALQPATSLYPDFEQLRPRIAADESFLSLSPDGQYLRIFAPVIVGETASHSSLSLIIPFSAITAPATEAVLREVVLGVSISIVSLLILWYLMGLITRPIIDLTAVANTISAGNLNAIANVKASNETGVLANAFNAMTSQLRNTLDTLEQRVAARTKDLATVAEVGTATATILDSQSLLQEVVDLTKERFSLYHSHIYLLDEKGENLVLTAGAGEPGRIMVTEGRSIPLDREQSLVARAARELKGVIVNDVTQAPDFLPNPLLPDTHSELAVPMIVGGKVIGVFDIQSEQVGRFTDSDINIQTTMAAQLAVSIQNVRSFEQARTQAELETLVNAIGQKIQRSTSVEDTLQIAVRELGNAIGTARVKANLKVKQGTNTPDQLN